MGIFGEIETEFNKVETAIEGGVKPVEEVGYKIETEVASVETVIKKTIAERLEAIEADFPTFKTDAAAFTSKVESFMTAVIAELKLKL